ncbi:MAG: penicillin-binding transpeptidase domain-containing protein [Clostridia bacterium]|nr:penicillin-binding transpeptidase domain-containing protein [Clostridia bacterium]
MNKKVSLGARRRAVFVCGCIEVVLVLLLVRLFYIQMFMAPKLQKAAYEQQTRDRLIAPERGDILDRNGVAIATTKTVASISVIHAQVEDAENVAKILSEKLELDYNETLEKVNKRVALMRIKTKVDKKTAEEIAALKLKGVMVDEDILRIYPYNTLAAQVIGFVGKDNQGIIGLESKYEEYLKGQKGKIMTQTDGRGRELKNSEQNRVAPVAGYDLVTSIDINLQQYAEQTIEKVVRGKSAKRGSIIMMNPQNGEMLAMASYPGFNLNEPYKINNAELEAKWDSMSQKEKNDALNQMWRNFNINDTYEPGSTFKVITSSAGVEEGVVSEETGFNCGGGRTVAGRYIKCWRSPRSHGSETFVQGVQNSCNPVFMDIAAKLGSDKFYEYMLKFGFDKKTGIDLPGEAVGIMHKKDKIGPVELATMSFGQSFQITPLQLIRAISSAVNGGRLVTPHFAVGLKDENGEMAKTFEYKDAGNPISAETSERMKKILESVVATGTGNKTYIPGYRIGGKTATSEKLPRKSGKYIASFCAFAPAENPQVIAIVLVDEPQGVYYGGQVAGPVMKELLSNALPYLGIVPEYSEEELEMDGVAPVTVTSYVGKSVNQAKADAVKEKIAVEIVGEGESVVSQFPAEGTVINQGSKILLYTG